MIGKSLTTVFATLTVAAGCGNGGRIATVETGGGSTAVAFVKLVGQAPTSPADAGLLDGGTTVLPDGGSSNPEPITTLDIVAVAPERGQLDVISPDARGNWSLFGSFFAGGVPVDVIPTTVKGVPGAMVMVQGGSIALAAADLAKPHRFEFPVFVFRRLFNGMPVDTTPPAFGMAVGDLDGDGTDELVAGTDKGVYVIDQVAVALGANPERPPPANGFVLAMDMMAGGVAVLDSDGDGRKDVLALDRARPQLRAMKNFSSRMFGEPVVVNLPAMGEAILPTGCTGFPALIRLAGGKAVALKATGETRELQSAPTPVRLIGASGTALAIVAGDAAAAVELYDSCAVTGTAVDTGGMTALSVALQTDPSGAPGRERLAVLDKNGKTVSLFVFNRR